MATHLNLSSWSICADSFKPQPSDTGSLTLDHTGSYLITQETLVIYIQM
jgi:hypothetical protein